MVLTTWVHSGHRHGFRSGLNFFDFCTRDTLLTYRKQTKCTTLTYRKQTIHDTSSKSGSYHKYATSFRLATVFGGWKSVWRNLPHEYERAIEALSQAPLGSCIRQDLPLLPCASTSCYNSQIWCKSKCFCAGRRNNATSEESEELDYSSGSSSSSSNRSTIHIPNSHQSVWLA